MRIPITSKCFNPTHLTFFSKVAVLSFSRFANNLFHSSNKFLVTVEYETFEIAFELRNINHTVANLKYIILYYVKAHVECQRVKTGFRMCDSGSAESVPGVVSTMENSTGFSYDVFYLFIFLLFLPSTFQNLLWFILPRNSV